MGSLLAGNVIVGTEGDQLCRIISSQKCTSRSTAESEYIALSSVAQEIIYIRSIWASMHNVPLGVTNVYLSKQRPNCESPVEILEQSRLYSDSAAALEQARVPWIASKLRHNRTG